MQRGMRRTSIWGKHRLFEFLGRYLLIAIEWLNNNVIHNIALTVVLTTVFFKLIALPFDVSQRKSMAKVTALGPQVQKIQKRYENNPEVLQKKTQELYKKEKVSPYASCMPMLVTMFIFMIFLRAMNFWSYIGSINIYNAAHAQQIEAAATGEDLSIEMDSQNDTLKDYRWAWVYNIWMPDSFLEDPIMSYSKFSAIPFDKMDLYFDEETLTHLSELSEPDYNTAMEPYFETYSSVRNGWGIMPILAAGSMLIIQLIQKKFNPPPATSQPQPGTGMGMTIGLAVFSGFICFQSNAAFSLDWLISNVASLLVTVGLGFYSKKKAREDALEMGYIDA